MDENKDKIKAVLIRLINGMDAAIKDASNALTELADDTPANAESEPVAVETPTNDETPASTENPVENDVERSIDDAADDFNARLKRALEILAEKGGK